MEGEVKLFTEQVELGYKRWGKLQSRTPSHTRRDVMDAYKVMMYRNSKDCSPRAAGCYKKKGADSAYEDVTAPLEDSKELLLGLKQCQNYSFLPFDSWPLL